MNMMRKRTLLSPLELKKKLPATPKQQQFVCDSRTQIERILDGLDSRLLFIVGPCSIHDITAAKEYATKLHALSQQISDTCLVVMRAFFEKPRTRNGWKGMLYDPHLNGLLDMPTGLQWARQLLLFLADLGLPAATEFLNPITPNYYEDLISWACIGARTSESQIHRQMASGLTMPVAFKNTTSGNLEAAVNGVVAASSPHGYLGIDENGSVAEIYTNGNRHAHIALRGGEKKPNYDPDSIESALQLLQRAQQPENLIVDCSHDNSNRLLDRQVQAFRSVMQQIVEGNRKIKGFILESHLLGGNQVLGHDSSKLQYAVSITDPCLDWETTEQLLLWAHESLHSSSLVGVN